MKPAEHNLERRGGASATPPSPRERPRVARRPGGRWLGAAMFLPAILYVVAIIGVPFLMAFLYAVGDVRVGSVGYHFVGLENFRSVLHSPAFRRSLFNSVIFTVGSQVLVIVGAFTLALALRDKFRGRGVVRFLVMLPWVAPVSLGDRKSTRLNSSHRCISYAVFCLKKKTINHT